MYGMPRAAYEAGACCEVLSLNGMSERLSQLSAVGPCRHQVAACERPAARRRGAVIDTDSRL